MKFADIVRRHRVLHGVDPFAGVTISRAAAVTRVRQVLLNLVLRLRASYALRSRPRGAAGVSWWPTRPARCGRARRSCSISKRKPGAHRRARHSSGWPPSGLPQGPRPCSTSIRTARETRRLEPGAAQAVSSDVIELAGYLHRRAAALR